MICKIMICTSPFFFLALTSGGPVRAQQNGSSPVKVSLCQVLSNPSKYAGVKVSLRVRVTSFRHGTQISDQACPKQTTSLIAEAHAADTDPVTEFYRFLASRRQSDHPVFATFTGKLIQKPYGEFIVKRNQVFQLEAVSNVSEIAAPTRP